MKRIAIFIILLAVLTSTREKPYHVFDILNDSLVVPPNGVHLYGNIFIEDAELMNVHYLEYLHFLAQDSSYDHIIAAYPDTNLFGIAHRDRFIKNFNGFYKLIYGEELIHKELHQDKVKANGKVPFQWYNYFSFEGTQHFPLVGISYEQAIRYCQWRTARISSHFNRKLANDKKYNKLEGYEVIFHYRLPTEMEWEYAASGGMDTTVYPYGFQRLRQMPYEKLSAPTIKKKLKLPQSTTQIEKDITLYMKDSILSFNCQSRTKPYFKDQEYEPEFIYENTPNAYLLFNTIGNVSEMVSEKGISKGGSFAHPLEWSRISQRQRYSRPEKWLGFRPVCEIRLVKKPETKPNDP